MGAMKVAAFGAWNVIAGIVNAGRCGFTVNAGYDPLTMAPMTPRLELLNSMKAETPQVWDGEPFELPNGRVVSRALDNRLGAYVALEAARRVAEAGDAQVDVVAVAAVAEEVG